MKKTPRGFKIYSQFTDSYRNKISVQESSAAMQRCCWIFVRNEKGDDGQLVDGRWQSSSPHLSVAQAKRLAAALLRFVGDE